MLPRPILIFASLTVLFLTSFRSANATQNSDQEQSKEPVVLVVKLNLSEIRCLKETGVLQTTLPALLRNRVREIRIEAQTSFLKQAHKVQVKTDKRNRIVSVALDDEMLDRLDYQPIEFKIYESNFDRVALVYKASQNRGRAVARAIADSDLFVRIDDQRGAVGAMVKPEKPQFKTSFGTVDIAWKQIAGIRFNADDNSAESVVVTLKKGDVFSATIDWKKLAVKTRWGIKELEVHQLESVTADRQARYAVDKEGRHVLLAGETPKTQLK
ncbi:MAG: hypothetical protein AB8B55_21395 [Mariniblastus sp.]